MYLFYTPDIEANVYTLTEEESKHCIRVLRLKKGDIIYLTDGKGNLCQTSIIDDNPKRCMVNVVSVQNYYGKRDYKLHLAVAPTKNMVRLEWFLEKATEIGIDEITPLLCEHSERVVIKTERLNKVITAAMKQSLKAYHPQLNEPVKFKDFITHASEDEKYIAWCDTEPAVHLKNFYHKGKDVIVLIGPEGDFSPAEVQLAKDHGFVPVSLGKSRLRTETAALATCMTINLMNEL